jgi:glycosyltransferase involved in cell wall biosynthesis
MKKILIDARLYGNKHTGIGRYTKNLLLSLIEQKKFKKYQFSLIVSDFHPELKKYQQIITQIPHYSWQEQLLLPSLIKKINPELVHFTHFNKPIFYKGKSVITIHDLIKHFSKGKNTTTKNPLFYWPKYWLYLFLTKINIQNNYLVTPSNYWRNFIIKKFKVNSRKIVTTYEAIDPIFLSTIKKTNNLKPKKYILYTGNLYPHKNVDVIIKALRYLPKIKLKIICGRDFFFKKYQQKYKKNNQVEFLGFVPDKKFASLYKNALCLVHPSFMEGFSLTGLESMALGCPVLSSNYSCLPEIYQDSVIYFDAKKAKDLAKKIKSLTPQKRKEFIKKGYQQIKKYSWNKTAQQTLQFYEKILT